MGKLRQHRSDFDFEEAKLQLRPKDEGWTIRHIELSRLQNEVKPLNAKHHQRSNGPALQRFQFNQFGQQQSSIQLETKLEHANAKYLWLLQSKFAAEVEHAAPHQRQTVY